MREGYSRKASFLASQVSQSVNPCLLDVVISYVHDLVFGEHRDCFKTKLLLQFLTAGSTVDLTERALQGLLRWRAVHVSWRQTLYCSHLVSMVEHISSAQRSISQKCRAATKASVDMASQKHSQISSFCLDVATLQTATSKGLNPIHIGCLILWLLQCSRL